MIRHCIFAAAFAALALAAIPSVSTAQSDDYRNDQRRDEQRRDDSRDERDHDERGDDRGSARGSGTSLTCESSTRGRRYCAVNLRDYEVTLVRRFGSGECDEGRGWGHDQRGVWVDGGCRAEFSIVGAANHDWSQRYGRDSVVRCESIDERRAFCPAEGRHVEMIAQISNAACVRNRSWGRTGHGIWVDRGCRADFRLVR